MPGLFLVGLAGVSVTDTSTAEAAVVVTKVNLTTTETASGAKRSYEARVVDADGKLVVGADLDIGGLADDPDLRVRTTTMTPMPGDPTRYRALVSFPADGDWVMVVRVGQPSEYVELFTEAVTGVGPRTNSHDLAANPSRRAVEAASSDFYARYDPTRLTPGAPLTAAEMAEAKPNGHDVSAVAGLAARPDADLDADHATTIEPVTVLFAVLHSAGALAWIVSVLGLVFANRMGLGAARNELVAFVARHYALLAGGGLLIVVGSGISNIVQVSPGLTSPSQLTRTGLGVAYLGVFSLKMALVAGSFVTSIRIGRVLPRAPRLGTRRLLSLGAMADEGPPARALALAEANARFGVLILACVGVLNQINHALH